MANFVLIACLILQVFYLGNSQIHYEAKMPYHHFRSRHVRGDSNIGEDIIFPESPNIQPYTQPRSNFNKCVHGFCDEVDDYPYEEINNALKNFPDELFGKIQGNEVETETRGGADTGSPLCETVSYIKFPQKALTTQNVEKIIVNTDAKSQGIMLKTCVKDSSDSQCGHFARFPEGYVSECVQKHSHILLVTFDNVTKTGIGYDTFSFPSCCICNVLKKN